MTCDRLVCANCAGRVSEGRCAVCRAERDRIRRESPLGDLSPAALLGLLVALCAMVLVAERMATA